MPEDAFFPDVYVQLINGGGARLRLANDGHVRDYPSWSPDSRWIATGPVKQVDAPARPCTSAAWITQRRSRCRVMGRS